MKPTTRSVRADDPAPAPPVDVIAVSPVTEELLHLARRAASTNAKVLLTGESGVGKDVIARYIHGLSPRASGPLVAVNCAGLTETLLESELFGHVRGSFTDAFRDKPGKLQIAHNGTLFLDEVGEMSLRMQALLLRFLETGEIQRVGSERPDARADVRVIAATNRNLSERVASGEFREDLLYRLRVIHLHVPPLRERREDIPALVEHFLKRIERPATFTGAAMQVLQRYRWPGNIRELHNVVEQAAWLAQDDVIDVAHLPQALRADGTVRPARERRRQIADELYTAIVDGGCSFWDHVHPLLIERDITRHDLRELVRRGLTTTRGNYRALVKLFNMPDGDYKRFMNCLAAHDCAVDYRAYRSGTPPPPQLRVLPPPPAGRVGRPDDHDAGGSTSRHPRAAS